MISEVIKLLVRPNSRKNSIDGLYQDRIKIRVSKPPEKGRANKELIKFISKKTGIPKNNIKISSGLKSNLKSITIVKDTDENIASKILRD